MDDNAQPPKRITRTRVQTAPVGRRLPAPAQASRRRTLNWPYALLSLVIGALLWFGVDLKRMEDMTLDVEVEFQRQLPADWQFVTPPQRTVRIAVRGARQEIAGIRKEELRVEPEFPSTAFDRDDAFRGNLSLSASQVKGLPAGVEIQSIIPDSISVDMSKTVTKYLTIQAGTISGTPQDGYAVGKVQQIDPPAVPVTASRSFLAKLGTGDVVRTKEFNVDGGRGLVGGMVGLEPIEKDGEVVEVPGMVYMAVEIVELPAERQFDQPFEVRALIDSPFDRYGNLTISPPSVQVTVAGPKSVVDRLTPGEILIYADIRDRIPAAPGEYNLKCRAIAPAQVTVTRIEPDTVKWVLHEEGAAASPDAPVGEAESK